MRRSKALLKLYLVVQLAIGIVFTMSFIGKLWSRGGFTEGLEAYRIVPSSWATFSALTIIALEACVASAHLTGYFLRVALVVGLGLLGSFGIAVGVNLGRGRALPCYCFGGSESLISHTTLLRLALLGFGEALLLKIHHPIYSLGIELSQLGLAVFWSIFLLVVSFWFFALADVLQLVRGPR
jgi:hypothetical protein